MITELLMYLLLRFLDWLLKANIQKVINESLDVLELKFDDAVDRLKGSGWVIQEVKQLSVDMFEIKPIRGSSFIPNPKNTLILSVV
jgi:hypothetical protein